MAGEDILKGIEDVDSEIVAVVEVDGRVQFGTDTVAGLGAEIAVFAVAHTVVVAVHYGFANVVDEG